MPGRPLLVSVVVPCLNRAQALVPTLDSILGQDYPHIECIVVDGGSTDDTLDILSYYADRIRWISEPDRGPADAINKGWRMSTGDVLAWLNASDLWAPGAATEAVHYLMARQDVDVVYGDCGLIDEQGRVIDVMRPRDWDLKWAVEQCDHIIHQPAAFVRRQVLEAVGWLDPTYFTKHDHELWLRIGTVGAIKKLSFLLAFEREGPSYQARLGDRIADDAIRLTRKFFSLESAPPSLLRSRRRAMSNAYLVGARWAWRYGGHLRIAIICVGRSFHTDPANLGGVMRGAWELLLSELMRRPTLGRLLRRMWSWVRPRKVLGRFGA